MICRKHITIFALILLNYCFAAGQSILYSPFISERSSLQSQVAGRAGNYYWLLKQKIKNPAEQYFEVYDAHLNPVKITAQLTLSASVIKTYLVAGANYFDQLMLQSTGKKTSVIVHRYTADGDAEPSPKIIASLPFSEQGTGFLLVRSEDRRRSLLLGFESVASSPPRLHALLFNEDWSLISYQVYNHPYITQPFIQDEYACMVSEHFNDDPVQLANNGQWMMLVPSRTNLNSLLFHFRGVDSGLSYKEIRLPAAYSRQDVALSLNNDKGEAFAGILSGFGLTTHKQVQVAHYSLSAQTFDFDSSYRFNTLAEGKEKNENITRERFIAVPGAGFMLLKEYGRSFAGWNEPQPDNQWDPQYLFENSILSDSGSLLPVSRNGYTRFNRLSGPRSNYERGDISLFYFPGYVADSCWSGIINKAQVTELNAPYLSYLTMPAEDKFFILYNNVLNNDDQVSNSTILDRHGNLIPEQGIIFWKFNQLLSFQQAVQVTGNETLIPYSNGARKGFAVLKFSN